MNAAATITRRAKSNLAFALRLMPREKRGDMVVFYAYCRVLDDLADDPLIPLPQRHAALDAWEHGLILGFENPDSLQRDVVEMRDRHKLPNELLTAIINGCRMDLQPRRYQTWEDLCGYIEKVSCAVGLVSIRLFGCVDPASERFAIAMGRALQLTNILRDIREDYENGGRVYLPLADLQNHGLAEADIAAQVNDDRFQKLMRYEAERAAGFYREAEQAVTSVDRKALAPARLMGAIYQDLLERMQRDGFRVFEKRYRVPATRKFALLARHLLAG